MPLDVLGSKMKMHPKDGILKILAQEVSANRGENSKCLKTTAKNTISKRRCYSSHLFAYMCLKVL